MLARLARRLRGQPDDIDLILPFDEVVAALGRTGERRIGLKTIELRSVVGSVDRTSDFDRRFRPTSNRLRERWQGINMAQRSGRGMPPISVYRIGDLYFVRDGHHRVSVALALGNTVIEAHVTEVLTQVPVAGISDRGDIVVKDYERLFRQRVPLPDDIAARIVCRDPWNYAELSENVEAWSFRLVQDAGEYLTGPRPPAAGTRRSTSRSSRCCTRPRSSAAARRPRHTCASRATATGSSARTSGATRSSPACAVRRPPQAPLRRHRRGRAPSGPAWPHAPWGSASRSLAGASA